jgi:arsenite methyltransferase
VAVRQAAGQMYESGALSSTAGGSLHPGGWGLTERMLLDCNLCAGDRVLDFGCGEGFTIRRLLERFAISDRVAIRAIGLDCSESMLQKARAQAAGLPLACAFGTALPVASEQVDIILAECSLSSVGDLDQFLDEAWRVLRQDGRLAVSDVYVRNPAGASLLRALPLTCGLRRAFEQPVLLHSLLEHGFEVLTWEDYSETLQDLARQMTSIPGSTGAFWNLAEPGIDPMDIILAVSRAKLGYFGLIAKKSS